MSCKKSSSQFQHFPKIDHERVRGVNFVAPPKPFGEDPMPPVRDIGATWIAVIPYAFCRPGSPRVRYQSNNSWQWWGERPAGVRETIRKARVAGLQVMLKPQVYVPGSWTGGISFSSEVQWREWEDSYEAYILPFAEMAEEEGVALLCIGTEFKVSSTERPRYWRQLIRKIRQVYSGKLTYAANWDEFDQIEFWDELDYIGVDAYFPLDPAPTPRVKKLKRAWRKPKRTIEKTVQKFRRPVLFTEFGYLSVDGCAYNNWDLEAQIRSVPVNEQAQANALDALFQTFWEEPYWHGGFIWKWFPNLKGHEGYPERDYTPQGKIGEEVVRDWYLGRR